MDRDGISNALAVLRSARSVELGPVGVAALRTPGYEAFSSLRTRRTELAASTAELKELLNASSPAARLYAALLLRELDPAEGNRALEALFTSEEPLTVCPGGCSPLPTNTLGEAARYFARDASNGLDAPSTTDTSTSRSAPHASSKRLSERLVTVWLLAFPLALVAFFVFRSCG